MMSSVPYAVRLPKKLAELLEVFAKKTGMSSPDAVRAAIEQSISNEYRILLMDRLTHKEKTIKRVRDYLSASQGEARTPLAPVDYSALMCFWHFAYMHENSGYANPRYLEPLLDITSNLISTAKLAQVSINDHYLRSKLDLEPNEAYESGIDRIKLKFRTSPTISYAEWLTRPLEAMSSDLNQYERSQLAKIFDPHLQTLIPVAILGAKVSLEENVISQDLKPLLPTAETCRIGDLVITLYGSPSLALVVSGKAHAYAFTSASVLAIATAVENNVLDDLVNGHKKNQNLLVFEFIRKALCIVRIEDQVTIHEHGGYRLSMSNAEFLKLSDMLKSTFEKPSWCWLIDRYRNLGGDI
jgi:predicted DNA-binding protein